jgi:1-acyl-sn-glycerol-3-phosphate acyltransferase
MWPYTWGRVFRWLSAPIEWLYRYAVTRTTVLGQKHLRGLDGPVIFAGTHHGFADMSLVMHALARSPARRLTRRLAPATAASEPGKGARRLAGRSLSGWYGALAFGVFPLQRTRGQDASLRQLVRISEAGNAVLIFPQGTPGPSRSGGMIRPFGFGPASRTLRRRYRPESCPSALPARSW